MSEQPFITDRDLGDEDQLALVRCPEFSPISRRQCELPEGHFGCHGTHFTGHLHVWFSEVPERLA